MHCPEEGYPPDHIAIAVSAPSRSAFMSLTGLRPRIEIREENKYGDRGSMEVLAQDGKLEKASVRGQMPPTDGKSPPPPSPVGGKERGSLGHPWIGFE